MLFYYSVKIAKLYGIIKPKLKLQKKQKKFVN